MRTITIFVMLFTMQAWQSSWAGPEWAKSTHMLPQYCKDKALAGANPDLMDKLRKTYGNVAIHLHHYCTGILAEIRAKSSNKDERDYWLNQVVHQMGYVSGPCQAGECVFYPELHTRWGWALGKQGKIAEAIQHYQLAFQAKPNYIPAYTKLSRLYLKNNMPDEARKVLELGLKANPNSRALKKRLKKIESSKKSE